MSCPSELSLSTYADGDAADAAVETHLAGCADCQARLVALRAEGAVLRAALADEPAPLVVPAFRRPRSHAGTFAAAAAIIALAAFVSVAPTLLAALLPESVTTFDPFDVRLIATLTVRAVMFVANNGGDIMTVIVTTASAGAGVGLLIWSAFAWRRRVSGPLLIAALALTAVLEPVPAEALDLRRVDEGDVFVAANETIDDTLVALGETVEIDGDVTGDLIAVGRRVIVRGRVGGQVYAAAQDVTVEGEVNAGVFAAGETVQVSSKRVGGNLYGFGQRVSLTQGATVARDVIAFGERVLVSGAVGSDLVGFANEVEVDATVGGDLTTRANRTTLFGSARIAGDVRTAGDRDDHLTVSPGAVVVGELINDDSIDPQPASRYLTIGFYVAQLLRFAAAFATGAVLLALVPSLRALGFTGPRDFLVAAGVGLVIILAAPAIAALVAVTVVGLPLAVIGFVVWLAGAYLAKVFVANFIGTQIMEATGQRWHYTVVLALGLLIVLVTVNVPFIGGVLDFVLTVAGLGLIVLHVWNRLRPGPVAATAPA